MKHNNYVFRVDSSYEIGSGHVMRCLALAEELRSRGSNCSFITRDLKGNINNLISLRNFQLLELAKPSSEYRNSKNEPKHSEWRQVSWEQDATETIGIIKKNNFDVLVVDHYGIWFPWEKYVSLNIDSVLVIDDLGDREHHCDFIVDQNLGSKDSKYYNLIPKKCHAMLGTEYALIRSEFFKYRKKSINRRNQYPTKRILINFGGGDPKNYIPKILKFINIYKFSEDITIDVILGPLNARKEECYNLAENIPNKVNFFEYAKNMAEILTNIDLVIGAAGSSSWERCCLGIPSIIFSLAYNQEEIAKHLSNSGVALLMQDSDIEDGTLTKKVTSLIGSKELIFMSRQASKLVDGLGVDRIIRAINA